jgi:type II secretory ATPase GspE/PulE/Tfp pilus assembly ATPase PilB-like protein/ActR/RegA family two-component response regulator
VNEWIARAARKGGLQGADDVPMTGLSNEEAWARVGKACGVSQQQLARAVAQAFSMNVADMGCAEPTAAKLLSGSVARKLEVFPIRDEDRALVVATANPIDTQAEQEVAFVSGRIARFEVAPPTEIMQAIETAYSAEVAAESLLTRIAHQFDSMGDVHIDSGEGPEEVSEAETAAGPVVKLTNIIIHEAISRGASDVHIQPLLGQGVVRFRTDGVLENGMQMPLAVLSRVVSRIKIMGQLDITDRLRPQDGRARVVVSGRKYDLRISTVPTRQAEKAVIRVLDTQGAGRLAETGIADREVERIREALSNRDGIVVVTGPTGSGKTTTLYGALREIATEDVNIMTVEDPVEYELAGLTQIQVEPKQGVTFATALKAILRQDPDVIFVGEIRDGETAEIAAQASLTGHLVLATLHTNDAVGAIRRFVDLGLDPGTLGEVLRGVLAQRLMRSVCTHCAIPVGDELTPEEGRLAARYGRRPVVRAGGCVRCRHQGYMGRIPVTEFMVPSPDLVRLMLSGASPFELQRQAMADGMSTLVQSALERLSAGQTTIEEVDRVIGGGDATAQLAQEVTAAAMPDADGRPSFAAGGEGMLGSGRADVTSTHLPAEHGVGTANGNGHGNGNRNTNGNGYANGNGLGTGNGYAGARMGANGRSGVGGAEGAPHVLLVDDDGTTRQIARALLEKKLGYRVSESHDGSDAILRFARGEVFDLMVLDLDMPILGGREVLRSVRGSMSTASMPIVVLTGTPDHDAEIELMELGADDYLRKPIDPPRLQSRVRAALRRANC